MQGAEFSIDLAITDVAKTIIRKVVEGKGVRDVEIILIILDRHDPDIVSLPGPERSCVSTTNFCAGERGAPHPQKGGGEDADAQRASLDAFVLETVFTFFSFVDPGFSTRFRWFCVQSDLSRSSS